MLKSAELIPTGDVDRLVVLLHGYGANGEDLIELAYPWQQHLNRTAFFSPNAPTKCPGSPFGYEWFALENYPHCDMHSGLKKSRGTVTDYLQSLLTRFNLAPEDLVLVGFSQGCMVALDQLYALPNLAGVVGFSGEFYEQAEPMISQSPVLLVHGELDTLVDYGALAASYDRLNRLNVPVQKCSCPGLGHGIDAYGAYEALKFIQGIFTQSQPLKDISSL